MPGGIICIVSASSEAAAPPVVPPAFRAIDDLGQARVVASVPRSRRAGYSAGMLAAWGISIFLAGFLAALFVQIVFEVDDLVFLAVAGVLWVAGFVIVASWLRRKGAQVVVLFEDGVAVGDGRSVRRWRWDEFASVERRPIVSEVKPDIPTDLASAATAVGIVALRAALQRTGRPYIRTHTYYWFFDRRGGAFSLDRWLPAVDDLAQAIDLEITDRLAPGARAALAGGQVVGFGAITLGRDALVAGQHSIPLAAVEQIEVERDSVAVVADGVRFSVRVAQVANLTLLLQLVEELRAAGPARPEPRAS